MKKFIGYTIILVSTLLLLQSNSCNSDNPGPSFPAYNYTTPINNPPDVFQVIYDISFVGDRLSYITFEEDAVWFIEKLGDSRIVFRANTDSTTIAIIKSDTLGLKGGYTYVFSANNNNYPEFNTLFTQFNKLDIEYNTFEPKF